MLQRLVPLDPGVVERSDVVDPDAYVDVFKTFVTFEDSMYGLPIDGESKGLADGRAASRRPRSARARGCCGSSFNASSAQLLATSYERSSNARSARSNAASARSPGELATALAGSEA